MSDEYVYDEYDYDNFNNYQEVDEYEYEENQENYKKGVESKDNGVISILSLISTWFIRIGMVVAFIVFIYYIFTGKFSMAFLYIIGLIVAYWFGFGLMFLLDKFVSIE